MGVRPRWHFVCGIGDADLTGNDPRFSGEINPDERWEVPIPLPELEGYEMISRIPIGATSIWPDLVFIEGGGDRILPVVGFKIASAPEDLARALFLVQDNPHEPKLIPLPRKKMTDFSIRAYRRRDGDDVVDSAIEENRWLDTFTPWYTDMYFRQTIHITHHMGWTGITREMLWFYVACYWA